MVDDGIDILVDVNGNTLSARMKIMPLRPAPIIVNWLGFPGSTGSAYHNYIIADDFIVPPGSEIFYSEQVLRLPCYQPNDRKRNVSLKAPTRQEAGLPEKAVVYCCFNGTQKITPHVWNRWMSILKQVPDSVLWLLESVEAVRNQLTELAKQQGIAAERIIFAPRKHVAEHLARYPLADLFLDTTPYGAHTTSSDALWMGVPVLTVPGRSFASRVCGSLVKSAGLDELICDTPARYVALAVELGKDRKKLAAVRAKLKANRDRCVLFDTPLFTRSIEAVYDQMWAAFKAGNLPRPNLMNLNIYEDIGAELDRDDVELLTVPNYLELYRNALEAKDEQCYIPPDGRVWTGAKS
jgi:predicted O-linked N-acetylglucosamine transferase (SPINDLY family)